MHIGRSDGPNITANSYEIDMGLQEAHTGKSLATWTSVKGLIRVLFLAMPLVQ